MFALESNVVAVGEVASVFLLARIFEVVWFDGEGQTSSVEYAFPFVPSNQPPYPRSSLILFVAVCLLFVFRFLNFVVRAASFLFISTYRKPFQFENERLKFA